MPHTGFDRDHIARLRNRAVTVKNKVDASMNHVERLLLLLVILLGMILPWQHDQDFFAIFLIDHRHH